MLKSQKVRLYPNKAQQQIISFQIGGVRYHTNTFSKVVAIQNSNQDTIQEKAINIHKWLKLRVTGYFYLKLDG